MVEEILFIQDIPEEDKQMLLKGISNIEEVLEEEQGFLEFSLYSPEQTYPFTYMAEGNFGIVFQYKQYVLKYRKECYWDDEELENEGLIYLALQEIESVPILYGYSESFMILEKVEGKDIVDIVTTENRLWFREEIEKIGEAILNKGYIPHDVEFFLTKEGKVKVLDLGLLQPYTDPSIKEEQLDVLCERWHVWLGMHERMVG